MCTLKMCGIKIVTIDMVPFFCKLSNTEGATAQANELRKGLKNGGDEGVAHEMVRQGSGVFLGHVYSQTEMNPPCTSLALTPSVEVSQLCQV